MEPFELTQDSDGGGMTVRISEGYVVLTRDEDERIAKRVTELEAENVKLRKLIRDMWHQSCTYDTTCDGCPRYVKHWDGTEECEFETRIIKLGIEVGYEW